VGYLVGYNHPPDYKDPVTGELMPGNPSQRPYLGLDTDCKYEHISEQYGPQCKFAWLRVVSATHSSLTVFIMYFIGRRWSGTTWGGLLAAGLLLFDMLNNIEGRLILMDVQLVFWCTLSLYVAIKWWDRLNENSNMEDVVAAGGVPAVPVMTYTDRIWWAVGLGLCCGNAFSVKMTGLATPALVGMESALGIWFLRRPARWLDLVMVLATGLAIYSFYFAIHFYLLTRHGDGDDEFMNLAFRKTIKENKDYEEGAVWEGFWKTMIELNIRMVVHNANILEPHPWQSKWWEWVFNLRGVSYYGKDKPYTYTDHMYLIGNHAIHLSVVGGLCLFVVICGFFLRYRNQRFYKEWLASPALSNYFAQASFCLAVYLLNMAPYVAVARSTFCYHYMPALVYGELIVARSIETLAGPRYVGIATKLFIALIGLVWFYYTPWIYGMGLTNDGHQRRRWIDRWN